MNRNKKVLTLSIVVVLMLSLSIFGAVSFDNVAQNETPAAENAEKVELADLPQIDKNAAPAAAEEPVVQVASAKTDGAVTTTTTETTTTTTVPEKNEYINENGEVEIPYDQAFLEEFESGKVKYSDEAIMVKFNDSFGGKVNSELKKAGIAKVELMFELEDSAWYTATLKKGADVKETMAQVRELDDVVVAEYDFEYEASFVDDVTEISSAVSGNKKAKDQWYLRKCGIHKLWSAKHDELTQNMTGKGVVVAVIDTGVDYTHEDLSANMWVNDDEIPDNGKDDDSNGYVDDYYGANAITKRGNGKDDHGHGTHVAGIIGAVNNNVGVVGIAYDSKIMAIKAGQASGVFNQSDIANAIIYAYQNGADVINMSFGGSASSVAVQDALTSAYTDCVLVAAAGNNHLPAFMNPYYPAALTYVLGVMSVDENGYESDFSNFDPMPYDHREYEICAPGEQMLSTLPNNRYEAWSGTSMAAPVVAAIAADLRSAFPDQNKYPTKFIYGQLAATSDTLVQECCGYNHTIVNGEDAYHKMPSPEIHIVDYTCFDTVGLNGSSVNNGDGVIDAGETIALGFVLRNRWGMCENAVVTVDAISTGGVANPYVTFRNGNSDSINYGSIGTYSESDCGKIYNSGNFIGWENPFYVTIREDCPNDYVIKINVSVTSENALDEDDNNQYIDSSEITLTVRSGEILPAEITEDRVLTADKTYIIPNTTVIKEGVTVKVKPGAEIQFWTADKNDPNTSSYRASLTVQGTLLLDGEEDNRIKIYPSDLYPENKVEIKRSGNGYVRMKNCDIVNSVLNVNYIYNSYFTQNYKLNYDTEVRANKIEYCTFYKLGGLVDSDRFGIYCRELSHSVVIDSAVSLQADIKDCLFYGNNNYNGELVGANTGFLGLPSFTDRLGTFDLYNSSETSDYIIIELPIYQIGNGFLYQDFAEYLGGSLACIETQEEFDMISDFQSRQKTDLMIGMYMDPSCPNSYYWVSGEPVGDWCKKYPVYQDINSNDIFISKSQEIGKLNIGYPYGGFLYEFDKGTCRIKNEEDLLNEWKKFYTQEKSISWESIIFNSVIINKTQTERDLSKWLRIKAPLRLFTKDTISAPGIYWGTTNEELIEKQIYDIDDNIDLTDVDPSGYLTEAPSDVWPFVVNIGLYNENGEEVFIVGSEEVTFRVDFNRPMNREIPLTVSFGSSYPYADYIVEGTYVSPTRWEGTVSLNVFFESGTQYLAVKNGKAIPVGEEPVMELCPDHGRFTFEIDHTQALSSSMQAIADENGIQLSWSQDDYDTMAGYSVYRSTKEDGNYERLNSSIIPATETTFYDEDVSPGVIYYYNFTVVMTDFTESPPSGKVSVRSFDTMAPTITHTNIKQAFTGDKLVIFAEVKDNVGIESAKLYWRVCGEDEFSVLDMTNYENEYSAVIPSHAITTKGLEYYIEAFDGVSYTYKGSADSPYKIDIYYKVTDKEKGDVDGNGEINVADALMLLQAVNDLRNLDAEQFARGDINGDGVLTTSEVLRVLYYINGRIPSVLF